MFNKKLILSLLTLVSPCILESKKCKKVNNLFVKKCARVCGNLTINGKLALCQQSFGFFSNVTGIGSPYAIGTAIPFDSSFNVKHLIFTNGESQITIINPGIYYVGYGLNFISNNAITVAVQLFLNGSPIAHTSRSKVGGSGSSQLFGIEIINVTTPNSLLSLVNVGTGPLTLTASTNSVGGQNSLSSIVLFSLT